MIKGSLEERMQYEDFIRNHKVNIYYPFQEIFNYSLKVQRFYKIRAAREGCEYNLNEINLINLMSLMDYVARIGGLLYTWMWYECIPQLIQDMPLSKAEWFISPDKIAQTLLRIPNKTVEAVLLKSSVSNELIQIALHSHTENDYNTFVYQLSQIPLEKIFVPLKLINAFESLCDNYSQIFLNDNKILNKCCYCLVDTVEALNCDEEIDVRNVLHKRKKIEEFIWSLDKEVGDDSGKMVVVICVMVYVACMMIEEMLGDSDPVVKCMQEILSEDPFQRFLNMYVNSTIYEEWSKNFYKRCVLFIHEIFGVNIEEDELDIDTFDATCPKQPISGVSKRLEFPTRISKNELMDAKIKSNILIDLFNAFGHGLENFNGDPITEEEFVYLFDGRVNRPVNYKTPYFWNKTDKQFAGLLRLLYNGQPTGIDEIILLVEDKGLTKSSVKWSARKQGLGERTLKPIEEQIQNIVYKATGRYLAEVDLKKQNKPKCKNDEKTKS